MPTELGSESQVKKAAEESSWQKGAATGMQDSALDANMAKQVGEQRKFNLYHN